MLKLVNTAVISRRRNIFARKLKKMMQFASENPSGMSSQEVMENRNIAGNLGDGIPPESCVAADDGHRKRKKIRNIAICAFFVLSILSLGYWTGWKVADRRKTSELSVIDADFLEDPAPMPSFVSEEARKPIPAFNDYFAPSAREPPVSSPGKQPILFSPTNLPTDVPTNVTTNNSTNITTNVPTNFPTVMPTNVPTNLPSNLPTRLPTNVPTNLPTTRPTIEPSKKPTRTPTGEPTQKPTQKASDAPGDKPKGGGGKLSYIPGNLTRLQNNLLLSEGLEARVVAETGKRVEYADGSSSDIKFHILPDAGATFPDTRPWNDGGWIYVSNSEAKDETEGGVGAITFDKHGLVLNYQMVLENTYMNCGGGRTPWNTWVSCEEIEFTGQIYQVDPTGQRPAQPMTLGSAGGRWESFAYDVRNKNKPRFFATEDHNKGTTRRFTPKVTHWGGDEWKMLHEEGEVDYLKIALNAQRTGGTFEWTTNLEAAKNNARSFYPQSEGIDIKDGKMYIVCKKIRQLYIFDLDLMTFKNVSTASGLFDGSPDQLQRVLGGAGGLLYFTEEGGKDAGIHA